MTTLSMTPPDTPAAGAAPVMRVVPAAATNPSGIPRVTTWRPERDINDSLFAMAARLDGTDPLFDDAADIAATRLLMAGKELDYIAARRALAGTVTVRVPGRWAPKRVVRTVIDMSRGPQ